MVNNNKILTVSYGTFSCTLEGFEDAFGTMKVIAEYFRDLAADDRFFGAEPPQIDAEMLAHIAQREISRQVEARRDDTGIVLRASDYHGTAPAAPAEAPSHTSYTPVPTAPTPTPAPTPKAMPDPTVAAPAAMPVAEGEAEEVAPQPAPEPDSIAAKLQRIRAVVSRAEPQPAQETEDDYGTDLLVGTVSDLAIDDVAEAEAAAPQPAAPDEIGQALARIDAASIKQDKAVPDDVDLSDLSTGQDLHGYDEHYNTEDDSVIALSVLTQVRDDPTPDAVASDASAETGEDDAETTPDADLVEEEDPEDAFGTADLADTPEQDADATDADEAVAEAEDRGDDDGLFDDPDAPEAFGLDPMAAVMAADAHEEVAEETDKEEDEIVNLLDSDDDAPRVLRMSRSELNAALAAGEIEELTDGSDAAVAEVEADDDLPEDDIDTSLFALDDDEDEDGDTEELSASTLSGEDEADLMRELAAVQAQFAAAEPDAAEAEPDMVDAEAPEDDHAATHQPTAHRLRQDTTPAKSEDDLSRLMAAAEEKMEDEQSSTNRATYTQLRAAAAVAAADRAAGRPTQDDAEDGAYRDDLASVVRPRRPVSGSGQRPDRPAGTRPAPLKLVAEQRIDLDTIAKDRGPVRPRRVASEDEDIIADAKSGGFAEFADRMGASDLSELLEAAAAYMSFVEGRNQFSRPQLMNKVRQMEGQEFKREDGLRSFGQLLRDGKIEKTSGGRFTASSDIGFRPDRRAAG